MGSEESIQYNIEKNMTVNIELNKACYFPGEIIYGTITLFPHIESFEKINDNPSLYITISQSGRYTYTTRSGKHSTTHSKTEDIKLVTTTVHFEDKIKADYSSGFAIPFSIQIPKNAYPSVNTITHDYIRHLFIVELPLIETKRTKMFFIKHYCPTKIYGPLLCQSLSETKEFKKTNFFSEKGSCLASLKIPKNYFYYDEIIPFEVNLDCSQLKLNIKSIGVILHRKTCKNRVEDHSKPLVWRPEDINKKVINLEKGLSTYDIKDSLFFPTTSEYNSVYPPIVYRQLDEHGPFEITDEKFKCEYYLYPNCFLGFISIEYYVKVEIYFDSKFTFDEELLIPIYFGLRPENHEIKPGMTSQVQGMENATPAA